MSIALPFLFGLVETPFLVIKVPVSGEGGFYGVFGTPD